MSNNFVKTISQYAPFLGTIIGGPLGGSVGTLIATAFGGDTSKSDELIEKIKGDPDAKIKFATIESQIKLEFQKIQNEMAATLLANDRADTESQERDRDSARKREYELAQSNKRDYTPAILAYLIFILVSGLTYFLCVHQVPTENKQILDMMAGQLMTLFSGAFIYYHGSSAGSKAKDKIINFLNRGK